MTETNNFRKGDTVYLVHVYDRDDSRDARLGSSLICAQLITLQSYGQQQGTGTFVENGRVIRKRIYPHELLIASREGVLDLARTEGIERSQNAIPRQIQETQSWLAQHEHKSRPDVVQRVQQKLAGLQSARPSVRIWFHDGANQENVVIDGGATK